MATTPSQTKKLVTDINSFPHPEFRPNQFNIWFQCEHNSRIKMASPRFTWRKGCKGHQLHGWGVSVLAAVPCSSTRGQCRTACCCLKTAALTFTSPPPLCLPGSTQVCTIMCADAEAWMYEWGCLLLHHPPLHRLLHLRRWHPVLFCACHRRRIFISIIPPSASVASLHTWAHPFLPSSPAVEHSFPPRILPSSLHESYTTAAAAVARSGLIYLHLPPLLPHRVCHCNCPPLPSSSPSSALWRAPEKAGKLSLPPAKVSVGWAAGLPLSLWRMILWMKTEEMALGELLERLRTVIQTIGGWQQYIPSFLSLVFVLWLPRIRHI